MGRSSVQFRTALPADPNNAALLYYQAFLLRPDVPREIASQYDEALRGATPSKAVRGHLKDCRKPIELVDEASKLPDCDWGIQFSKGLAVWLPDPAQIRLLAHVLRLNAQVLAADGEYDAALRQVLIIRRFAEHVGHDTPLLHLVSNSVDFTALLSIQHILGVMPPDADRLRLLKEQLAAPVGGFEAFARAMWMDVEMAIQTFRTNPDLLTEAREELAEEANDEETRERARALTDEVLNTQVREPYATFLEAAANVLSGDGPYRRKQAQIEAMAKKLEKDFGSDPAGGQLGIAWPGEDIGEAETRHAAVFALFQTALEVYLAAAETGRLPEKPANDWPRDPFTGEDFDYEITRTGFILRQYEGQIPGGGIRAFEFSIHDPNMLKRPEPWEAAPESDAPTPDPDKSGLPSEDQTEPIVGSARWWSEALSAQSDYRWANDLEAIVKDDGMPPAARQRAERALTRLRSRHAEGLRTPEPFLIRAALRRVQSGDAALRVIATDQDADIAGIRVKELHVDANGVRTSLTESYPAYVSTGDRAFSTNPLLPVTIRQAGMRKDPNAWEEYLIDSCQRLIERRIYGQTGARKRSVDRPPVWISAPEPGRTRVFVCLYDRTGHESEYVEVENLLHEEAIDPLREILRWQAPGPE